MRKFIESLIDRITMYRLLMYYLIGLLLAAEVLSIAGVLHYKPIYVIISSVILVGACWSINKIFEYIFEAPTNYESSIITGLILSLLITPNPTGLGITFLLAASGLAMASKYLFTIKNKHIFNPAAVAVALTALGPNQTASWWVGTSVMLPFVIVGGVLIVIKIRRENMVLSFLISSTLATILYSIIGKTSITTNLHSMLVSSPLFFLGFVMLTEPLTSPPTSRKQIWYGALVGILLPPQVHILKTYSSPELALLVGNLFSYIVSPKQKLLPILKQKTKIATDTMEYIFSPLIKYSFLPGQYIEWTLPHINTDSRGSRRYFTLASSPTENDLRIGVKFYPNGSSFKKALSQIDANSLIAASQISGDFVMPSDTTKKLAFIAGGIGITPFRSMAKYLVDTNDHRNVVLLYSVRTVDDIAYKDIFIEASNRANFKTIYFVTDETPNNFDQPIRSGFITTQSLQEALPDYLERIFYISGTHPMVEDMRAVLKELGIHHNHIKADFFPGYV